MESPNITSDNLKTGAQKKFVEDEDPKDKAPVENPDKSQPKIKEPPPPAGENKKPDVIRTQDGTLEKYTTERAP